MYLVGALYPNRERLEAFLRYRPDEDYVTSAEVNQELLHRFVAIDRRAAIDDALMLLDDPVVTAPLQVVLHANGFEARVALALELGAVLQRRRRVDAQPAPMNLVRVTGV